MLTKLLLSLKNQVKQPSPHWLLKDANFASMANHNLEPHATIMFGTYLKTLLTY